MCNSIHRWSLRCVVALLLSHCATTDHRPAAGAEASIEGRDGATSDAVGDSVLSPSETDASSTQDAASGTETSAAPDASPSWFDAAPSSDVPLEVEPPTDPLPPRPLAPTSQGIVTSQRPTFRWLLPSGTDGARLELCSDRACSRVLQTRDVMGSSATAMESLPPGTVFWRLTGRAGARLGATRSATWQFYVGARSAEVDTSWLGGLDVNGDGYSDVAATTNSIYNNEAYVYLGGPRGVDPSPVIRFPVRDSGILCAVGWSVANAGDLDGDGYSDLAMSCSFRGPGSVLIFRGGPAGLSARPSAELTSPSSDEDFFGSAVAGVGDVNGDGYADLAVGTDADSSGHLAVVRLYYGNAHGVGVRPALTLPLRTARYTEAAVAGAGDLNGDGFADMVTGSLSGTVPPSPESTQVFLGGPEGLRATPIATLAPQDPAAYLFALPLRSAGDLNGDGRADLVLGATDGSNTRTVAWIYYGTSVGVSPTASLGLRSPNEGRPENSRPAAVAGAGDVDGDGFGDLVLGTLDGTVQVYYGAAGGLSSSAGSSLRFPTAGGFGASVTGAQDVNGDGFADVLVGAPSTAGGWGAAYVFHGTETGLGALAARSLGGGLSGSRFGTLVVGN